MQVATSTAIFVSVALLLWLLSLLWPLRRLWQMGRRLPGPPGWPLIGNLLAVRGDANHSFTMMVKVVEDYGSVVRVWAGPRLYVMLADPGDVQYVLGNATLRNRDSALNATVFPVMGNGLICTRDEVWKMHRKLMTPSFHFKVLNSYVKIFGRKARMLCDELETVADGRTINLQAYSSVCTSNAICETAIGCDSKRPLSEEVVNSLQAMANRGVELMHNRLMKPWLHPDAVYAWCSEGKEAEKLKSAVYKFLDGLVAQKLKDFNNKKPLLEEGIENTDVDQKTTRSILDVLIESSGNEGSVLSRQDMRDELSTIALAGFETTSITISTVCLMLAMHPLVQDEVSRELHEIFGDDQRDATLEDINKMDVIGRVIKETLRMYPVAPMLHREVGEDLALPSGHILPAGCIAMVYSYSLHRDARYYPDPEAFVPDRWRHDAGERAVAHPYAYLPFGAGQRNCIGQKYAILQLKSVVSALMRRFTLATEYTMKDMEYLEQGVGLKLGKPYNVQLTRKTA